MGSIANSGILLISPAAPLVFVAAVIGIIVWGVTAIVKAVFNHQEREQMIARGMNPNATHETTVLK
jgi:hypothetical protein